MKREKTNPVKGIVVGYNKIPIDKNILSSIKGQDIEYTTKCLEANRHNNATTTYYLSLKKLIKEGGSSDYDFSSPDFN